MTKTTIETHLRRKFIVESSARHVFLDVMDTAKSPDDGDRVFSLLDEDKAKELALALLGDNAKVITDLPVATLARDGYVETARATRSVESDPDDLLALAKSLLAIHAFIVKHNEEQEAAKVAEAEAVKAKEFANTKRRDALATEFRGYVSTYHGSTSTFKAAIDRIIELEEAAKVS